MNPPLASAVWWNLFIPLAFELAIIVGVGILAQSGIASATWRRILWQTVFVAIALTALVELSGIKGAWPAFRSEAATQPASSTFVVQTSTVASSALETRLSARLLATPTQQGEVRKNLAPHSQELWWPGWIWLAGMLTVGGWMAIRRVLFFLFAQKRRGADDVLMAQVNALARRLNINRAVRTTVMPGLAAPIAYGIVFPKVSVPPTFERDFNAKEQEVVLAHELAHLAARDPLWHAIADFVCTMLWWHPLVWLARRELRSAAEAAADESSQLVENGPTTLAQCLLTLGKRLSASRSFGGLNVAGNNLRSGLGKRIKRLVALPPHPGKPIRGIQIWLACTIAPLALMAILLAVSIWLAPSPAKAGTLREALQKSIVGVALVAAFPAEQPSGGATHSNPSAPAVALQTRWFAIDRATIGQALSEMLGTNAVSSRTNNEESLLFQDLSEPVSSGGR